LDSRGGKNNADVRVSGITLADRMLIDVVVVRTTANILIRARKLLSELIVASHETMGTEIFARITLSACMIHRLILTLTNHSAKSI
jgi:hypothetical protein